MIAAYATGHGFGHMTRLCEVLRAVRERAPALPITFSGALPEPLVRRAVPDLLSFRGVRESRAGMTWAAGIAAFGVALNRFNVSLTGYAGYRDFSYFPSLAELAVTGALVVLALVAFDLGARYLPVYGRPLGPVRPRE